MYQRILVPVNESTTARRGLQEAIQLAKMSKGRIRLVHVDDELRVESNDDLTLGEFSEPSPVTDRGVQLLAECLGAVERSGVEGDVVLRKGVAGVVYQEIALEVKNWSADIVVLGTHARSGLPRLAFGSNADEIVHCCDVPVLQVKV